MTKSNTSLKHAPIFASFSVDDAKRAKAFYGDTLGLDVRDVEGMEGQLIEILGPGDTRIMVYAKGRDHTPPTSTVLNIPVTDIEAVMQDLKSKGVTFEIYTGDNTPMGIQTDQNGLNRDEEHGMSIAWFKDPAGNFVAVMESN